MDPIETPRLILRAFQPGDAADLFAYLHQPRATCFLENRLPDLAAAEQAVVELSGDEQQVAIALKESGRLIGDMFRMFEPPDTYSVGWHLNAAHAGAGYALEAARALFQDLFTRRQARRLYAYVEEHNHPSRRLCEKLGMRQEGLFREFISFTKDAAGEPVFENTMQYAILRKEWQAGG